MSCFIEKHCPSSYATDIHQTAHEYYHAIQVPPTQRGECYHSISPSCTGVQQGACLHCIIWGHLEMTNRALGDLQVLPDIRYSKVNYATKPPRAQLMMVTRFQQVYSSYPAILEGHSSPKLAPPGPKNGWNCLNDGNG